MRLLTLQASFLCRVRFYEASSIRGLNACSRSYVPGPWARPISKSLVKGTSIVLYRRPSFGPFGTSWALNIRPLLALNDRNCNFFRSLYCSKRLQKANGISGYALVSRHPTHALSEFQQFVTQALVSADPSHEACHIHTIRVCGFGGRGLASP